jgi:hypothetical protein
VIDALLYAVRDGIRAAGFNYGAPECEIMEDGKPQPRCGRQFVSVHGGRSRPGQANDNNLYELFDFSVTLTMRVTASLDRVGDKLIALNIERVPQAYRDGFNAKIDQLKNFLHMNWEITVIIGRTPPSANDNLVTWAPPTDNDKLAGKSAVYGFCEPARFAGADNPTLVGSAWMRSEPAEADGEDEFALKAEMRFSGAKRFQPQTGAVGLFV